MKNVNTLPDKSLSISVDSDEDQQMLLLKEALINKLILMREGVQPLLFNAEHPQRDELVQRANFLYALIFKIKQEYNPSTSLMDYINVLEYKYPLASQTIKDVKRMDEVRNHFDSPLEP